MSSSESLAALEPRQASTRHGIILLLAAVMPIMAITALIPVLPQLLREFAHVPGSEILVPLALTVPALCVAIFSPFAGWLSDRMGRKRLLVGSLLIYALLGFLPWFLVDLFAIIGSRIILGIMEAIIMTLSTALIGDYFEGERRQRWIAAQIAVASVAATVLLAAGGLLADAIGTRGPFLLYLAGIGVALAVALMLHEPEEVTKSGKVAVRHRDFVTILPLALVTFGVGIIFYTILVHIGPILELSGPVTPGTVGLVGAIANIGVVCGAFIYKLLSNKMGPLLLALGLFIAAAGYTGVAMSSSLFIVSAFAILACLGSGIMLPNLLSWTMSGLPAAMRGQGMGIWTGSFFLGQFVAPLIVGALSGRMGGMSAVIQAIAIVIVVAAIATSALAYGRARPLKRT